MPATWSEAPASVLDTAREIIAKYHPALQDARIGFIFRSEGVKTNGRLIIAKASKVSARHQVFMDFDFIIWISEENWDDFTTYQRQALVDHELCHCVYYDASTTKLRGHDVEEFICIIQRHGFWNEDLLRLEQEMYKPPEQLPEQLTLADFPRRGVVATLTPETARILDKAAEGLELLDKLTESD